MRVDEFDFELPAGLIALRPVEPRDTARLLVVRPDGTAIADHHVYDLPSLLEAGDVLVVNDTKVIPARLFGQRQRGEARAKIDVTLHKRESVDRWRSFARPAKKLEIGERIQFFNEDQTVSLLSARVVEKGEGGEVLLEFSVSGPALDAALLEVGQMPLPPYIAARRAEDKKDTQDYQTIFANQSGAVAAPTAGLHFTPKLLAALDASGIELVHITLHVGAGTFLPVKVEDTKDHRMHAEWGNLESKAADALNRARQAGRRIVAVGTTSLRLLESAVQPDGHFVPWSGDTSIFITPGYRFRAVDALMTNFHLPRSTLLMLVSAFSGLDRIRKAYRHAIDKGYRFYSYGDTSLLFRAEQGNVS